MELFKTEGLLISQHDQELCIEAKEEFCRHSFDIESKDFDLPEKSSFVFFNKKHRIWFDIKGSDVIQVSTMNGKAYPNIKIAIVGESETGETLKSLIEPRGIKT
jgi:hypothetical protein